MFNVGQRPDVADILVVITDGRFDEPNAAWNESVYTRAQNISIITVSLVIFVSFLAAASACCNLSQPLLSQPSWLRSEPALRIVGRFADCTVFVWRYNTVCVYSVTQKRKALLSRDSVCEVKSLKIKVTKLHNAETWNSLLWRRLQLWQSIFEFFLCYLFSF